MNKIKYLFLALVLPFMTGCEDWLNINRNPDKSTASTADQLLPIVVFYASQQNYDHAEYGVYLSQALTTGGRSQTGTLAYKSGWEFLTMNRHPQWRRHFYDIGVNANELIKEAKKNKSYNYELIARTILLQSTLLTTDMFGDMPHTEVYQSIAPKYDTQESIYAWMENEANTLIALYNNPEWANAPSNMPITVKQDRIFSGDLEKWKHYTQALKARIMLRKLPNWDNNAATCQAIITAVDEALSEGWAEPRYKYDGGTNEKNCPWGSQKPIINSWESRSNDLDKAIPSQFFMVDMLGLYLKTPASVAKMGDAEDPRLARMMEKRTGPTTESALKYRYLENNIGMGIEYKETHFPNLYATTNPLTQNAGYVPLITFEELMFMKAEALYWKGAKQEALDAMKEAVDSSMVRYGVSLTSSYYLVYTGQYKALNPSSTETKIEAASIEMGARRFPTVDQLSIAHIMQQKYIALYLQPEQWNDLRRYNYSNTKNGVLYDGAPVYPTLRRPYNLYEPYWMTPTAVEKQEWVNRINYDPETEEKYNRAELERLGAYKNSEWLKKPMIWAIRK